jgi:hypothetical protein
MRRILGAAALAGMIGVTFHGTLVTHASVYVVRWLSASLPER